MSRKRTWEEFIEKATKIYGDRIEFIKPEDETFHPTNKSYVSCKCNKCGKILTESVNNILFGKDRLKCCDAYSCNKIPQEEVIRRLKDKLGEENYDFSLVKYKSMHDEVDIICKKHGKFSATLNNLLAGKGCKSCGIENRAKKRMKSHEQYVLDCEKKHGKGKFIYVTKYNGYDNPITYRCTECGKETTTSAGKHLEGTGCKYCHSSSLERTLIILLDEEHINYIHNKQIGRKSLDLFFPEYNIAIECQGRQHFTDIAYLKGRQIKDYDLNLTIKRDIEKYRYCLENNIQLLYFFNKDDNYNDIIFEEKFGNIYTNDNIFDDEKELIIKIKELINEEIHN